MLQSDSAFELVKSGAHQYWIPLRNRLALAEMIAEQEADVYGEGGRACGRAMWCWIAAPTWGSTRGTRWRRARVWWWPSTLHPRASSACAVIFPRKSKPAGSLFIPKGVWDKDEVLQIRTFDQQSGGDSVALNFPGSREGPKVMLTTIDKMVGELRLDRVDFIKMDIEGAERKALVGARDTVARFKPRMAISMEHLPDDFETFTAVIAKLWPDLKISCGPCHWVNTELVNRIQPEVLYVGR